MKGDKSRGESRGYGAERETMSRRRNRRADPWKTRQESLEALGFASYAAYLESSLWKSIRRRRYSRKDGKICSFCGGKAEQIHHDSYDLKVMAGKNLDALFPACGRCHGEGSRSDKGWILRPSAATQRMRRLAAERGDRTASPPKRRTSKRPDREDKPTHTAQELATIYFAGTAWKTKPKGKRLRTAMRLKKKKCCCAESETEIRWFKSVAGAVLVQHQCLTCGLRLGQTLPHQTAEYYVYDLKEFEPVPAADQGGLF